MSRYMAAVFLAILLIANGDARVAAQEPKLAPPSCSVVYNDLQPCIPYLSGGGGQAAAGVGEPTKECCSGVKSLQPYSESKSDRVALCQCFKSLVGSVPGIDLSVASNLPGKCNVNVHLPKLSLDFDCSKA